MYVFRLPTHFFIYFRPSTLKSINHNPKTTKNWFVSGLSLYTFFVHSLNLFRLQSVCTRAVSYTYIEFIFYNKFPKPIPYNSISIPIPFSRANL